MPLQCWSCKKFTMELREDKRYYECPCGATENIGGASDTEHPPAKGGKKS